LSYGSDHVVHDFGELGCLGGPDIDHAQSLFFETDFGKKVASIVHTAFRQQVPFFEMAAAFFTAGDDNAVDTVLKGLQEKINFEPASARRSNNPDVGRVLQT